MWDEKPQFIKFKLGKFGNNEIAHEEGELTGTIRCKDMRCGTRE